MPNGDNWQGDVLRDLRGGAAPQGAQAPPRAPGAQLPAQGPGAPAPQIPGTPSPSPTPGTPTPPGPYGTPGAPAPYVPGAPASYGAPTPPGAPGPHVPAAPTPGAPGPGFPPPGGPQPGPAHAAPAHAVPQPGPAYPYQAEGQSQGRAGQPGAGQPGRAVRAPDSRPTVDGKLAAAQRRRPRHGEAFTARAVRAVRRTVSSSSAREVAEATRAAELLQQPVTTGRQISVTSIRGGAGKTTVAALLGTTYAHYRQDPVLFVEADPALGSLPIRLGAETLRWTTGDVADIVEPQMSLLDVTGYLVQLRDNAWLLPGSQGQIGAMLDTRSYERAMVALRRYFGVTVVDCETLPAEVARVALSASQARVLTTPATLDGIASMQAVLQWMQGLPPHVIAGTVVVLTEQTPHPGINLAEATRVLRATGTGVHVLPYDRHLAAGGTIRTELLARSTRQTAARLAADVFQLSQKRH
ncbi:MinD/ParA family protein [Streptomyces sp. NPDC058674]|uniref:MinD/ParA family ATP-binding protein n=1 Tax=Streptomyces sp. NPDC058674 TaxID=3346592 RepID=UPI0036597883